MQVNGSSSVNGEAVESQVPGQVPNVLAVSNVPAPEKETTTAEPKYMTEDQVKALLAAQKEEFERTLQSRTDKMSSRIEKQVQAQLRQVEDQFKVFESAGQVITPEVKERIRQKVMLDAYAKGEEETASPPATLTPMDAKPSISPSPEEGRMGQEGKVHPVLEQSFQIFRGLGLDPNTISDEAAGMIDQETKDAETFLKSVRKAAAFEYGRTNAATSENGGGNAARVAGYGAVGARRGNPIENVTDPGELFRMAMDAGRV